MKALWFVVALVVMVFCAIALLPHRCDMILVGRVPICRGEK